MTPLSNQQRLHLINNEQLYEDSGQRASTRQATPMACAGNPCGVSITCFAQARVVVALVSEYMLHLSFTKAISSLHGDVRALIDQLAA